ncbi:Pickpocket protein 28 [Lucilia cuprina]|nr:Pickpocket protein 28 [Lucilia cuprina]
MKSEIDKKSINLDSDSFNLSEDDINLSLNSLALSDVPSCVIIKTNFIYGNEKSAFKAVLKEYSKKTSVHGLNYIFEIHRPFYEKLYWIIALLVSLYLAIYYMWESYDKWSNTPVILGFDETLVDISTIPFPTITICPENKRDMTNSQFPEVSSLIWSEIMEYGDFQNRLNISEKQEQRFLSTLQICDQEIISRFVPYMTSNINMNVAQNLLDIVHDTNTTITACEWKTVLDYSCRILKKMITEDGVCFQFNGLRHQDMYKKTEYINYHDELENDVNVSGSWSLDGGYQGQGYNAYPLRSILPSVRNGFRLELATFGKHIDYLCGTFKQGYKVFLNSPDSIALTRGNYILVPKSKDVMITVVPQFIKSQDNLMDYPVEKRQCYFNKERNLRYFKFYTQNNCQTECLTNYTIAKCGCARFWMPRPLDIPICDITKLTCYTNAAHDLELLIANQTARKTKDHKVQIICDCIPACNSLEYNFEITQGNLDANATLKAYRLFDHNEDISLSRLIVHYKESQFTAIKRTAIYDHNQLIADCGAIFGLFMGGSILTIIEFIYFFSNKNNIMFPNKDGKTVHFPQPEPDFLSLPSQTERSLSLTSQALSDVPSDLIIRSRIKYGSRWSACKGLLAEYSKSTSVHGLRYIFEVHRPFYEKLYWIVLMLISFYFAISLMWDTYLKWLDSPVILGFDETLVPINKIPFPTITICPEIKMDTTTFDFTNVSQQIWSEIEQNNKFENLFNLTDEELQHFAATLQICESDVIDRFASHIPKDMHVDVAQALVEMALAPNTTLPFCKWNGRFYFCDKLFKYVMTDEGVCYQFNGLQAEDIYRDPGFISYSDKTLIDYNNYFDEELPRFNNISGNWSLDDGYVNQGFNAYPQRTVLSSARNGLFAFMIGFEHNFDYTCRTFKQGYKVFLNSPESVPLTTGNYILVPHDEEVLVSIIPQYVISTDNLHGFGPEKRQCYFNDERYLRYFKSYSQSNCQTECLANYTINKCGCAKFWMPKPLDTPVCSLAQVDCYSHAADEMNIIIANQTKQKLINSNVKIMCDCMPSCNSLDYNFEISRAHYDFEKTVIAQRDSYEHDDGRASRFSVYFKEPQFTAIKRTVMFGVTTLIANCGGIFGLFMGISSLSIIEFIYFFSVRLFNNLRKRHFIKKKLMETDLEEL